MERSHPSEAYSRSASLHSFKAERTIILLFKNFTFFQRRNSPSFMEPGSSVFTRAHHWSLS